MLTTILISGLLLTSRGDSLFYNSKNPDADRILFYDKDCFIWIKFDKVLTDSIIEVTYGQYKSIGDTVYFSYQDTTRKPNKYFCYCPAYKGGKKHPRLYNKPETYPPGSIERVYKDMFKTKPPNFNEIHLAKNFKAIRQKGKIKILDTEYVLTNH